MAWGLAEIINFFRRRSPAENKGEAAGLAPGDKGRPPEVAPENPEPEKPAGPAREGRPAKKRFKKSRPPALNRHGLPVLSGRDDLFRLFTGQEAEQAGREDFAAAAGGIDPAEVLAARRDRAPARSGPGKPYPEPAAEIDLHRLTSREAVLKTESFVLAARQKGLAAVRIITGKGLHSQGRAVLPDAVEGKIVELKKNRVVRTFVWEKKGKLKSGALLVYLQTSAALPAGGPP